MAKISVCEALLFNLPMICLNFINQLKYLVGLTVALDQGWNCHLNL